MLSQGGDRHVVRPHCCGSGDQLDLGIEAGKAFAEVLDVLAIMYPETRQVFRLQGPLLIKKSEPVFSFLNCGHLLVLAVHIRNVGFETTSLQETSALPKSPWTNMTLRFRTNS